MGSNEIWLTTHSYRPWQRYCKCRFSPTRHTGVSITRVGQVIHEIILEHHDKYDQYSTTMAGSDHYGRLNSHEKGPRDWFRRLGEWKKTARACVRSFGHGISNIDGNNGRRDNLSPYVYLLPMHCQQKRAMTFFLPLKERISKFEISLKHTRA